MLKKNNLFHVIYKILISKKNGKNSKRRIFLSIILDSFDFSLEGSIYMEGGWIFLDPLKVYLLIPHSIARVALCKLNIEKLREKKKR